METPLKTREMIAYEFGYDYKMLMRRLKNNHVVLPQRVLLCAKYQKLVYETLYYPKNVKKE